METPETYVESTLPTSKESLTVYLQPEIKEALKQMSEQEKRSMAFLAEQAVIAAVEAWKSKQPK